MNETLLPHYWKKIAVPVFFLFLGLWIAKNPLQELIPIDPFKLSWLLKSAILGSLLLFVCAKEMVESQLISKLRLDSLLVAITAGAFCLILETFLEILFEGENADLTSGYKMMLIVLLIYSFRFYIKSRRRQLKSELKAQDRSKYLKDV